ncbi:MAG TPA: sugar kinase [Casimicrobiaceae bacterium]|nr:sugar kinase [Casimicrobiaceae bacterium]
MTVERRIVSLGEPMIEFNQVSASDAHTYLQGFGGDTSNMAIASARLGRDRGVVSAYVTRVGDDAFGRMLLALWAAEGVVTDGVIVDDGAPTGVYFVTHGASGHAFSYLRSGSAASRMSPSTLPHALLRTADVLHVSGISQAISASACDACFAAMAAVREAGGRISYDPNLRLKLWPLSRARAIVRESVGHADWVLPSLEDATALFGDDAPDAIVDTLHRAGAKVVVLKLGVWGCIVSNGKRRERIEGRAVDAIDATGAGDCFDGAFATRMLIGDDAFEASRYANAAAALATTGFGAVAPLPYDAAVRALLDAQGAMA